MSPRLVESANPPQVRSHPRKNLCALVWMRSGLQLTFEPC